jgi:hypothetical protein
MTKIICRANDCIFWDEGTCSSEEITYDPEHGCLTYEGIEDVLLEDEEEWEEEDILDEDVLEWDDEEEEEEEEEEDLLDLDEDEEDEDWGI